MMKVLFVFLISLTLISCSENKGKLQMPDSLRYTDQDIPLEELPAGNVNTDSVLMLEKLKTLFPTSDSLVEGRPASFFLRRSDISTDAKNFYLSLFPPTQDDRTLAILDSLLTRNDTTRPFYYFLFLRFYRLGDDWANDSELLTPYALHYSLEFVDEFYKKLQMPQYRWSYHSWVVSVSLNKFPTDDIRDYVVKTQIKNARKLTTILRRQIMDFADSIAKHNGES